MEDHSFPPNVRIKSRLDFDRAFREGVVVADDVLVLHVIYQSHQPVRNLDSKIDPSDESSSAAIARDGTPEPTPNTAARLGLSISKRVGNAPTRNRWKRLIREVFRRNKHSLPALDIVARPKKGASADYQAIWASFPSLITRAIRKLAHNQN